MGGRVGVDYALRFGVIATIAFAGKFSITVCLASWIKIVIACGFHNMPQHRNGFGLGVFPFAVFVGAIPFDFARTRLGAGGQVVSDPCAPDVVVGVYGNDGAAVGCIA
jgi:hypothetical protein